MEQKNDCTDYEKSDILSETIEETQFIEECVFLPGILEEFSNIKMTPEPINAIESEAIFDDAIPYSPNCLALTVVPDYRILSIKNIAIRSVQVTYKILFSTIVLNIIKLFC